MKDFSQIFSYGSVSIGYIPGTRRVLFIKTGQGGSIYGDENRYLNLAVNVNRKYGFTVFVSATLDDDKCFFELDMALVERLIPNGDYEIYYLGVSKGGLIGCWYGADNPKIRRIMSVNAPLMINYHGKTLPAIKKLGRERLIMVYGSLDPSYGYIPFAEKYAEIKIVQGADHNFKGMTSEFYDIITRDLLEK